MSRRDSYIGDEAAPEARAGPTLILPHAPTSGYLARSCGAHLAPLMSPFGLCGLLGELGLLKFSRIIPTPFLRDVLKYENSRK